MKEQVNLYSVELSSGLTEIFIEVPAFDEAEALEISLIISPRGYKPVRAELIEENITE